MKRRPTPPQPTPSAWPYFVLTLGWSGFFYSLAGAVMLHWGTTTLTHNQPETVPTVTPTPQP